MNFNKLGIDTGGRTTGKVKLHCPRCRDTRSNKRDKPLSVNLDSGLFHCHYCNWSGSAKEPVTQPQNTYTPAVPAKPAAERPVPITELHRKWLMEERGISAHAIDSMALTSANAWMSQSGSYEACIGFNYYEQGKLVNTKFRSMLKHFKMLQGAETIPYNIDGILSVPECIITEGEIDALSFITAGRMDVISVPSGANTNLSWLDRFIGTHFDDKQTIFIAVDTDAKGVILRDELVRRLGMHRCRIVSFDEGCKDANEHLLKYGADSLKLLLDTAPEVPLEGVFTAIDINDDLQRLFLEGLKPGLDTGWSELDKLCTWEAGRLCLITGVPGCGKSEFVDELVMRLNLRHGWKTAFFSPENMPMSYHMRKLIEKATGERFDSQTMAGGTFQKAVNYLHDNFSSIMPDDDFTLDNILNKARTLVARKGIRILVVDPYNRIEHHIPPQMTETQYISMVIDKMSNFAWRNNCLFILVAHPRKINRDAATGREPRLSMYDINGSAHFYNKTDYGLIVERDRTEQVTRVRVEKVKFKHLGQGNGAEATFVYNLTNGRYVSCTPGNTSGIVYDNTTWI
ncbi:DNA primase [Bacteroides sp. 519]|nr:bifunctional DNA primase/helicase [Bacteroides sp. 519]NDV59039.1 DNA primase [Bacteroides sp. 519]